LTHPKKPVLGAMSACGLIVAGVIGVGVAGTASGSMGPTPTTVVPAAGVEVQAHRPAASGLARAVSAALPAGASIRSESTVKGGRADYEELSAVDDLGAQWGVTVYRSFDPSELDHLESTRSATGTTWIGAEDPDLTSIYFLNSSTGVGVWIGHQNAGPNPVAPAALQVVAERLSTDPIVVEATR
jgi:hypothetical protein